MLCICSGRQVSNQNVQLGGRIPSDYIPFAQYDMPENAATYTDAQSDAFAGIFLANLNATVQEDPKIQ